MLSCTETIKMSPLAFEKMYEEEFEYLDVTQDPEFIEYSRQCEEYNDFTTLTDFYDDGVDMRPRESVLISEPAQLANDDVYRDNFVCLGKTVSRPLATKREKTKYIKPKALRKIITFQSALPCTDNCPRVKKVDGSFIGSCLKVHPRESEDNFLVRNGLRSSKTNFKLVFTKQPSLARMTELLATVKSMGGKQLDVVIEKEVESLDNFFRNKC